MILSKLIQGLTVKETSGDLSVEVSGVSYDSRRVEDGHCFVAISGNDLDGCAFIEDAINNGACAVISEKKVFDARLQASVVVSNSREALSKVSSEYFARPSEQIKLIGITGTNGKTTITYLLESIFKEAGFAPGVIGTIGYRYGGEFKKAAHTTPESYDLQKLFRDMLSSGIGVCIMEVSSHALTQYRVDACHFDCAVFTNLTPEHLDYHDGMEDYFKAKALLFERILEGSTKGGKCSIVNIDDSYGVRLKEKSHGECVTYGFSDGADVWGHDFSFDSKGMSLKVKTSCGIMEVSSALCGKFNAQNILASIACAFASGIDFKAIVRGVEAVRFVPGRFQVVPNDRGVVSIVDYAHTPDALERVLTHAHEIAEKNDGRLITVFGCGGDRDRSKRPLMGNVASLKSDVVIVTSDNPRTEKPGDIIDEIMPGVLSAASDFDGERGFEVFEDRARAIERAVSIARSGDVVLVAGKGHEDYQILGTKKIHFDDRDVLEKAFRA